MDVGKYELLLKAVELRNLTKAATALGYTQSGASHIISSIEAELGVALLRRDHSGTHLTLEGEMLLPSIQELVLCGEKIRALSQSILGIQAGVLRVASFASISLLWLPQIVGRLHALYPDIRVEIVSETGSYQEMEEFLLNARVNCGFVRMPVDPALNCIPLMRDPMLVVLPPDHPLAAQEEPITFAQLAQEPFLMPTEGNNYEIEQLCKQYAFEPQVAFTMHEDLSLLAMAENGLGYTILPSLLVNNYPHKAAVKRLETDPARLSGIATRANYTVSPLTTAFIDLVCQMAREYIPEQNRLLD